MTPHDHTTLVDGCYRCDLNRDEIAAANAEVLAEAHRVLETDTYYDRADLLDLLDEVTAIAEYRVGRRQV